jgi:hypothetical protein
MVPEFAGRLDVSDDRRTGHIHDVTQAARVGGDGLARQDGRLCQEARACVRSGSGTTAPLDHLVHGVVLQAGDEEHRLGRQLSNQA